jgi:hypothetical protein
MKKTIDSPTKKSMASSGDEPGKRIKFLNARNNMEHYLKINLTKSGWQEIKESKNRKAQILWSN